MARKFLVNIDLNNNQIINVKAQVLAVDPGLQAGDEARFWYNSTSKRLKYWDGTQVIDLGNAFTLQGQNGTYYLDRANHTGTQTAATISDFNTAVQANRLDQLAAPTADLSLNNRRIINLSDPIAAQDAATKSYVDMSVQGLDAKQSVRAATTANITLSGAQIIDGVSVVAGDRVLVKDQTTAAQNGIYVVADSAWSRADDSNTWDELVSAFVFIEEGETQGDTGWVCTVDPGGTLGTTAVTWTQFSGAGSVEGGEGLSKIGNTLNVNVDGSTLEILSDTLQIKDLGVSAEKIANGAVSGAKLSDGAVDLAGTKVTGILPDSKGGTGLARSWKATGIVPSGNTTATVVHNFNTKNVLVAVYEVSTDDQVYPDIRANSVNSVDLLFAVAPTANQYRYVIMG